MFFSIHVLDRQTIDIREALFDFTAGKPPVADATGGPLGCLSVDRLKTVNSKRWVSLLGLPVQSLEIASDLAFRLRSFVLCMELDDPNAWGFYVYNGNEQIGSYRWEVPVGFLGKIEESIDDFEQQRLEQLGVQGLDHLRAGIKKRSSRISSTDPQLERQYRTRISDGQLALPKPVLMPELPRLIHKLTGLSTISRIRKILSEPTLNVTGAASEFGMALGLPDWISAGARKHGTSRQENQNPHRNAGI